MSDWTEVPIETICSCVLSGGTPRTSIPEYYVNGTVPWLKTKEVNQNRIVSTENFISEEGLRNSPAKLLPINSIVVAMFGDGKTAGRVALTRIPLTTNQACCNLVIDSNKANPEFVFYQLMGRYDELVARKTGSGQQNLSPKLIRGLVVGLPPLPEQRAIASVLSSLDDKIDLLHRQNKTLEAMAETLFRQWFVEEAKDDWEVTTFAMHIDAHRGLSYKGSGLAEVGMGVPMHNLNSVFEGGGYKEAGIKYYSGYFKERHVVRAGDVIVTNTEQGHEFRLIGFPAIVPNCFGETGIFSQHIYRVVPKEKTYLTPEFLYYLMMVPEVREQITSATNGSTVNMLAIDGLQRPTFRLPPKSKVAAFHKIANDCRRKAEFNHRTIRTLEKLRDNLLPKLMSGEVRVQYE